MDPWELLFRLLFEFIFEKPFTWLFHRAQRALLGPEEKRRLGRAVRRAVDSVAPDFPDLIAIDAEMRVLGDEDVLAELVDEASGRITAWTVARSRWRDWYGTEPAGAFPEYLLTSFLIALSDALHRELLTDNWGRVLLQADAPEAAQSPWFPGVVADVGRVRLMRTANRDGDGFVAFALTQHLLHGRVEAASDLLHDRVLQAGESRAIGRVLLELSQPQIKIARDTYLEVAQHLGGPSVKRGWRLHVLNLVYWQMGFLGNLAPVDDLAQVAESHQNVIVRHAACIALGRLGYPGYIYKAAEETATNSVWAKERHAWWLTYAGEQHSAPGVYRDLKARRSGVLTARQMMAAADPARGYFQRPLALAELAYHVKEARPTLLANNPSLKRDLVELLDRCPEVDGPEGRTVSQLRRVIEKS